MIRQVIQDALEMTRAAAHGQVSPSSVARTVLLHDSFHVMLLNRIRESARRLHVPGVNRFLRRVQTALYGIEIGKEVELGSGVYFVHTPGTVLGGTARIGDRVTFLGGNTVGTAKDNGYPTIEDDVTVGAGARVLGPIRVGAGAVIGANAVVLSDVAPGAVVGGIPAKPLKRG